MYKFNILLLTLLISVSPAYSVDWNQFGGDLANTHYEPSTYSINLTRGFVQTGNFTTEGYLTFTSASVYKGYVYIGSSDGHMYKLNKETLSHVSNFSGIGTINGQPYVENDVLFIGIGTTFYMINTTSMTNIANVSMKNIYASPKVYKGIVYISDSSPLPGRKVFAFNSSNLNQITNFTTGDTNWCTIAIDNETDSLFMGSDDYKIWKFNTTLSAIGNFTTSAYITSSSLFYNGFIYEGSDTGLNTIFQVNATTMQQVNNITISPQGIYSSPAGYNNIVYVGTRTGVVFALNASNISNQIANFTITGNNKFFDSSPIVSNGIVYIGSSEFRLDAPWWGEYQGVVYALNASNMVQLTNYSLGYNGVAGSSVGSTVAVDNGILYFGSNDANIYAITLRTPIILPPFFISLSNISNETSFTINWETDKITNLTINYGTTDSLGTKLNNDSFQINGENTVSGLSPGTLYYYNLTSSDINGNCNTTSSYTINTIASSEQPYVCDYSCQVLTMPLIILASAAWLFPLLVVICILKKLKIKLPFEIIG